MKKVMEKFLKMKKLIYFQIFFDTGKMKKNWKNKKKFRKKIHIFFESKKFYFIKK